MPVLDKKVDEKFESMKNLMQIIDKKVVENFDADKSKQYIKNQIKTLMQFMQLIETICQ